ncbi:type I secretion system permease/ATPase [Candidatus Viadribacter manganicus]|uniref:type I secretion system permease/ATPase n=1 Tax=Candidatus Viadribacter manganicus TaxID=1759059 RepID=UPI001D1762BD|nr:type I secretion system permease/ATPase [Candidatus Viadribacter manganicus]
MAGLRFKLPNVSGLTAKLGASAPGSLWAKISAPPLALWARVRGAIDRFFNAPIQSVPAWTSGQMLNAALMNMRTHVVLIFIFSAAINILYLAPSLYMLQVYDRVIPTGGVLTLVLLSVILVGAFSIMALLDGVRGRLLARAAVRVERLAADAVIEAGMRARRAGAQPEASARDLDNLRAGITSPAAIGLLDLPWTPLFVFICFVIHFWIGVLALAGAALIFLLALANERRTRDDIAGLSALATRFYSASEADLSASETIHALGANRRFRQRRAAARAEFVGAQTGLAITGAGYAAATKAMRMLLQSAALGLGAYLAVERQISPGAIIAATILTARAFAPVEQIVGGWRQIGLAYASYEALKKLFSGAPPQLQRTPLPAPQGKLSLEQVSATAPDGRTMALQAVSFQLEPGEILGVIGPSGAGKTTLARVLAGACIPRMGAVRLDNARYSDWDEEALASHIGYLPQRIELFDGTVADNIAAFASKDGGANAIGEKVVAAAMQAGAHELILRLPRGYETELGTLGAGLSPGQAQRVALARALYNDPRLVVLDEPNSHLDAEGEAALTGAIQAVRARGGVVVVMAHRAGVINVVDKLMLMREGRIVEFGPRQAVLAKLQAAAGAAAPVGAER